MSPGTTTLCLQLFTGLIILGALANEATFPLRFLGQPIAAKQALSKLIIERQQVLHPRLGQFLLCHRDYFHVLFIFAACFMFLFAFFRAALGLFGVYYKSRALTATYLVITVAWLLVSLCQMQSFAVEALATVASVLFIVFGANGSQLKVIEKSTDV